MSADLIPMGNGAMGVVAGVSAVPPTRPGFYNLLANEVPSANPSQEFVRGERTDGQLADRKTPKETPVLIEFFTPTQLKDKDVPERLKLVGDCHVLQGNMFVIGGAPGVGKSRAAVALAVAGATGADWFGLKVHRKFRTLILQAENGIMRLKTEFGDLDCAALDDSVLVSTPPPDGFAFEDLEFCSQLQTAIQNHAADVVVVDTWSDCVSDSMEKDYKEAFKRVLSCLPKGENRPALGIVAHTRKPRLGERASGRALLALLSGSQVLGRKPRSVFVIQPASDDTTDRRIVFTCCKNNDGEHVAPSAWELGNGQFKPVKDFDWDAFNSDGRSQKKGATEEHLREVFQDGDVRMLLKTAAEKLQEVAGVGRTTAYAALKLDGEFGHLLDRRSDRTLGLAQTTP